MFEIKKHFRGDLSLTIDTAPNEEVAAQRCREYVKQHPDAKLRIWDTEAKHWVLWHP